MPKPIVVDAQTRRDQLRDKTVQGLGSLFPLVGRDHELHVENVRVKPADYSSNDQKKAILHARTLAEPVVGDLVLKTKDGKTVETKKGHILAHLPYFTERHTMIVAGNEYEVPNQLRLKPGVYTRERGNGEYEAAFNLAKGDNFRISMEPETGKLRAEFGTTTVPLRPMLKALGVHDSTMKQHWGDELFSANVTAAKRSSDEAVLNKLVGRLKRAKDHVADLPEAKERFLQQYFDSTRMDPYVTERTLGKGFDRVTPQALLAASQKLIRVHKGEDEGDDRDSLEFKTVHTVDDFFKERLEKDAKRTIAPKLVWKINNARGKDLKAVIPNSAFTKSLTSFLTNSAIAAIPTQYNPVELVDHASKMTSLGEGGITSDRAIPFESRKVHNTHFGVLDPVRTPECYDAKTEVYTAQGWMPWAAVTQDTRFACRIDERLEFHTASKLFAAPYEGLMYGVQTGKLDMLVTPNHRVLCRPYAAPGESDYRIVTAEEAHNKDRTYDTGHAAWEPAAAPRDFKLPAVVAKQGERQVARVDTAEAPSIAMEDWAEFVGWYLSEGYTHFREDQSAYRVKISQSKYANPANYARIDALLARLPFTYCRDGDGRGFSINTKQLAAYTRTLGRDSSDKFLPQYLLDAALPARERLLAALLAGDGREGSVRKSGKSYKQQVYCTSSKELAAGVERLAISLGYAVRTRKYEDNREERYLSIYEVRLLQHRERTALRRKGHYYTEQYAGTVYCATVPGGLLYVRRNGSVPVWSGNSGHAGVDVRAAMGAHKDDHGNLYGTYKNAKTGKRELVPVTTLAKAVVGFAGQDKKKGKVDALKGNDVVSVNRHEVDYFLDDHTHQFSPTVGLVPLLDGMQGNRAIMGSKFQTQALPLLEREVPFVQAQAPRAGESMEKEIARLTVPTSKVHGTVERVDANYIYIRPDAVKRAAHETEPWVQKCAALEDYADAEELELLVPEYLELEKTAAKAKPSNDDGLIKLPYDTNFPLAAKTYLHNTVKVKAGDKVVPDQMLADSNFTKDDHLALGKNLSVGYLAYYGKNSNDAVVISEGASKKLTSEHMYKETLRKSPDTLQSKQKYVAYYGTRFTKAQLDKLDESGIAKPGQRFEPGDPLILALEKSSVAPDAAMLGHLHKSLVKPYRDAAITWEHHTPGEAVEAVNAARQAVVTIRTHEQMKIGDKLANRFGGKGVVSEIIPDHKMVRDERDKPIDVLFTSAGIVSRINPAQVVEGALGKVVEKTGKPIVLPQFMPENNVEFAKKLLAKHGVKDKEKVYDPVSGRHINDVFVGRSYIHKLFKSTETNYAARGVSSYDVNLQPTKGGDEGAKGLGKMEINTLLAHNARNVLKDAVTVKSEKSDDYWRALEFGLPPPPPKSPFVVDKLKAMMTGAGINIDKRGTQVAIHALTDDHVSKMSAGALTLPELEKSKSFMVTAKDLKPEKGGLFDPNLTGGLTGTKWSHIELPEATLNPLFEEPARRLLGLTKAGLQDLLKKEGGDGLKKKLNALNLDELEKKLRKKTDTASAADLNDVVKQLKYVQALKASGHKGAGDAYVISKIPVIPPVMRPVLPSQRSGELQIADANYLYRDVALAASGLKAAKETGLDDLAHEARHHLYAASAALSGVGDPVSPQLQARGVKGFVAQIAGQGSPKQGFLFKKVLKRQQDLSMRATATPDNTLDMDQIGVPEDMLWKTYEKFVMKGLIGQGYQATKAKEMIEQRHPAAKVVLENELKVRPIFVNRAPSLHKHNMVAAYPVPVPGKTLRINPFMEKGQNLDYDGDTMQLHVPVSQKAVAEAQGLTLSKLLFSDKSRDDLMVFPQHEAIIGAYLATAKGPRGAKRKFKTKADALAAYKRGEISLDTPVEIG
jgi:DNA-directed RNA polymerase beta subunit